MKLHFSESGIHVLRHQTLALCHCRSAAQSISKAGFDIEDVRHSTSLANQSLYETKRHFLVFSWKMLSIVILTEVFYQYYIKLNFRPLESFWVNNTTIFEFGFHMIWTNMQISEMCASVFIFVVDTFARAIRVWQWQSYLPAGIFRRIRRHISTFPRRPDNNRKFRQWQMRRLLAYAANEFPLKHNRLLHQANATVLRVLWKWINRAFWMERWPQQEIPENNGEKLGEGTVYDAKNYKRFSSFLLISCNYHFVCRY